MPIPSFLFRNTEVPIALRQAQGLPSLTEATLPGDGNFGLKASAYAVCGTGTTGVPDLLYTSTSQILLPNYKIPPGMRFYPTRLDLYVSGGTAWTTGVGVEFAGTLGSKVAGFPLAALTGYASYSFPGTTQVYGFTTTATGSSSTTTKTNVSDTYVAKATASLVGTYVTSTGPTTSTSGAANIGQTRRITDHDTGSFTVDTAWLAAASASDTFIMWGLQGKATMGATTVTPNQTGSFGTSAAIDLYVSTLSGTGPGQNRRISANTSASVFTTDTFATAPDTSTIFSVTNSPNFNGCFDFYSCTGHQPVMQPNEGLNLNVVGTMGAGSPIRAYVEGFYAF
jgi:hypothetical protein